MPFETSLHQGKKKIFEISKFYNNSRGCVRGHTATSYKQKANLLLLFSFLLLKVTTKQSTKAFRNKNLKSANGRRRRRRMAGHFRNSAGDGGIIGYMVFSFTVNHLISNFLVFLLPSSIRFFSQFCQYNPVSFGTKSGTKQLCFCTGIDSTDIYGEGRGLETQR